MNIIPFAKTSFRNEEKIFGIKQDDRRRHMYVLGKTGTGKTTLLRNMAIQDIKEGNGLAVVDPHGELVEFLLENIPSNRINDVVYFNPADMEYPIGFNPLEVVDHDYRHLVASGLMGIFTKIWANVWSARMEYIMQHAILALIEMPEATLLGIQRILVDEDFRNRVLNHVTDPVVKAFWVNEYERWQPSFRNEAIAPIQNKVGQFLSTPIIRNLVGQPKSTIDLPDVMNKGKILLINVSKGLVGEDNSALLGAMFITKFQLATMERVRMPESERRDFYLYVDEFQNFVTDAFASILSEARKYRLNLIVAHQYIAQLVTPDSTKVRDAIFGNVGTIVCFRCGAGDAEFLEKEFAPEFMAVDLVNIPNFNITLRLMIDGVMREPFSATVLPPMQLDGTEKNRDIVIKHSRDHYGVTRKEVEYRINRWSGVMEEEEVSEEELRKNVLAAPLALKKRKIYQAVCARCGKTAFVPFLPKPRIPVYCAACLKIVKSKNAPPKEKDDVDLSGLKDILGKTRE